MVKKRKKVKKVARKASPKKRKKVAKRRPKKAAPAGKISGLGKETEKLEKVGEVTHYFPHVKAAAALVLKDGLKVGDRLYFKGHTTNFKEALKSMQLDHVPIQVAQKGQEIGILVKSRVRIGDSVYKI